MATVADEWGEVDKAFKRLERFDRLQPTLTAMKKLAGMVKHDPAFADVRPRVSLASIFFYRRSVDRAVMVAWDDDDRYEVSFVDPPLAFSETTKVGDDAVAHVLREYLDKLGVA